MMRILPSATSFNPNGGAPQPISIWPDITWVSVEGWVPVAVGTALMPSSLREGEHDVVARRAARRIGDGGLVARVLEPLDRGIRPHVPIEIARAGEIRADRCGSARPWNRRAAPPRCRSRRSRSADPEITACNGLASARRCRRSRATSPCFLKMPARCPRRRRRRPPTSRAGRPRPCSRSCARTLRRRRRAADRQQRNERRSHA